MKLNVPFDLDFSLCCGQVFRWRKIDGWWFSVVGGKPFKIRQCGGELEFVGVDADFVRDYFGLGDDLAEVCRCICKDKVISKALKQFEGLRIAHQNPWECLVSYICATNKNIPAIEDMLQKICIKFGEKTCFGGYEFYCFPTLEKLAKASLADLQSCSLGYRAKYVKETSLKILESGFNLESLKVLPYADAKLALLNFSGVGPKVADCVLLFSLGKTEAFPVDVWVKRIMLKYYGKCLPSEMLKKMSKHQSLTNGEYQCLNGFGRQYFGKYAGYAQEYLFHYERTQHQQ
jgi:N-glycosylase/DNA lyase